MKTFITGGSGMVGQNLQKIMPGDIYLNTGHCDLTNLPEVYKLFVCYRPETVIHLAGKVGGIQANMNNGVQFFQENLLMNTYILKVAFEFGINRFTGMLSTCIYPDVAKRYPLNEDQLHEGPPQETNFGYGYAKRCMAVMIDQYNKQYGTKYNYLIPSNLYGYGDHYEAGRSHFVAALIKKIHDAKISGDDKIFLFGDGTPLRQFMLAADLARVIVMCIHNDVTESFNVAPDEVYTIREIAEIALKACDAEHLKIEFDTSKPNGQMNKTASNEKMKSIFPNFQFTPLYDGIKKTYSEFSANQR